MHVAAGNLPTQFWATSFAKQPGNTFMSVTISRQPAHGPAPFILGSIFFYLDFDLTLTGKRHHVAFCGPSTAAGQQPYARKHGRCNLDLLLPQRPSRPLVLRSAP